MSYKGFTWSKTLTDTPNAVQFLSMEPAGGTHSWDFGDGSIPSTEGAPLHQYTQPGFYDITYKYHDGTVEREYFAKRAVRVYPDRAAVPYATWDLAAMQAAGKMSGVPQNYSTVPAGSKIDVIGTADHSAEYPVTLWVIENLQGTAANPIHLCWKGAQITSDRTKDACIILKACRHVIIDMEGAKIFNGGIDTWQTCTDLEIGGPYMRGGKSAAVKAKFDSIKWPSLFFQNMMLHNADIADFTTEGCYFGNSFYMLREKPDGTWETEYKHSMPGAKVFRNKVRKCGWDGLQLGCGDSDAEFHDNWLEHNATEGKGAHSYSMQINSGFQGEIYNNICIEGPNACGGAVQFSVGFNSKFYNNLIIAPNAGFALFIKTETNTNQTRTITDPNLEVMVFGNTLINPKKAVYVVQSANQTAGEVPSVIKKLHLYNNIFTAPRLLSATGQHVPAEVVGEFDGGNIQGTIEELKFVDPTTWDYHVNDGSTSIDTGYDTTLLGGYCGAYDLDGKKRTSLFDAGAYAWKTTYVFQPPPSEPDPEPEPEPQPIVPRKGNKRLILRI